MTALTEAKDSLAKASTPEPFSTSKTSNWIARGGGLPPYIQHIAHDLVEKRGKSESNAIQMAIGIVKNWCSGKGKVDKNTRAAACKAVGQWEKLKNAAKSGGKSVAEARDSRDFDALLAELDAAAEGARYRLAIAEGLAATLTDESAGLRAHDRACASAALLLGERPRDRAHAVEMLREAALWDRVALIDSEPKPRASVDELAEARKKAKAKGDDGDGSDDESGADGDSDYKAYFQKLKKRGMGDKQAAALARQMCKRKSAKEGLDLSEFLGRFDETKHPRLHGKFAAKIGGLRPGETAHLGHGVHVQAPSSPGGTFAVKLSHAGTKPDEMALARDASHAAAVAAHARRHRTLKGAGSSLREAFDFAPLKHPRDRLGKFRDVPVLPSLPGDRGGSIGSVSRPTHIDSPALGAQRLPHSPGRPHDLRRAMLLSPPGSKPRRDGEGRIWVPRADHWMVLNPDGGSRNARPDERPPGRETEFDSEARSPGRPSMRNAREVHNAFAAGRPGEAGSVSSRDLGNGHHALYSYATPVALRRPDGSVVYDPKKYSVTTSKQLSQNRSAVPENLQADAASHEEFRALAKAAGADVSMARSPGRPTGKPLGQGGYSGQGVTGSGPGGLPTREDMARPTYSEGPDGEDFNDAQYGGGTHHSIRVQRGANQGGDRVLSIENDNGRAVLKGPESNAWNLDPAILSDLGEWPQGGDVTRRTLSKDERQKTWGTETPEALELPNGHRVEVYHQSGWWVHTAPGAGGKREVVRDGEVATHLRAPRPKKSDSRTGDRSGGPHAAPLRRAAKNYDLVELTLDDGSHTHGNVTDVRDGHVHMEGGDGQEIHVPLRRVRAVEKIDA